MAQIENKPEEKPEAEKRVRDTVQCKLANGLELRADGVVRMEGTDRPVKAEDIPERNDLPKSHPLYGKRLVPVIPCGMSDCILDEKGRLVPADSKSDRTLDEV